MTREEVARLMVDLDCPRCGKPMDKMEPIRDARKPFTWSLYWNCRDCAPGDDKPCTMSWQQYTEPEGRG